MSPPNKRRERKNVMLCYPFETKRLEKWPTPYIVQPKYDGIRCVALVHGESVELVTATGLEITTVPHIKEELRKLNLKTLTVFDGELYIHRGFLLTCSIVKRNFVHNDHKDVEYIVFDIISNASQLFRIKTAEYSLKGCKYVKTAPYFLCQDIDAITDILTEYYQKGYEGVIIRHGETKYETKRSTNLMKWKPTRSDTYQIVGYQQETSIHGDLKDSLGSFVCQGSDGSPFNVGSGLTQSQRNDFWRDKENLIGCKIDIRYQELSPYGIPRFPIFIQIWK